MNTKSAILCIFEGESREPKYFKTIQSHYFDKSSILLCSYGNDIYELFREIDADQDLDIVELLRETKNVPANKKILEPYSRDDFNQVFLFFDFEYQDNHFDVNMLGLMISIFNEETESGKLFVSYPMVEAIRDVPSIDEYIDHKVSLANCTGRLYKPLSAKGLREFQDPRKITKENWDKLIEINILKANFIVSNNRSDNTSHPIQSVILSKQSEMMNSTEFVYVLSSFPLFIFHQKSSQLAFLKGRA
ncbi:MAG: hypothetical protein GQ581_03050 [Methyloprofundus sp.]|nr:hypothetical protein [Methyloprofundus sp.]